MKIRYNNEVFYRYIIGLNILLIIFNLYNKYFKAKLELFNRKNDVSYIEIERRVIDLGKVGKNEKAKAVFNIKNCSPTLLSIESVIPECHCTATKWTKIPIGENKVGRIVVEYDKSTSGVFQKLVYVYANTKESPIILTLRGRIL